MSDRKAILKVSDMSDDMQRVCIEVSMNAIDKYHQEKVRGKRRRARKIERERKKGSERERERDR